MKAKEGILLSKILLLIFVVWHLMGSVRTFMLIQNQEVDQVMFRYLVYLMEDITLIALALTFFSFLHREHLTRKPVVTAAFVFILLEMMLLIPFLGPIRFVLEPTDPNGLLFLVYTSRIIGKIILIGYLGYMAYIIRKKKKNEKENMRVTLVLFAVALIPSIMLIFAGVSNQRLLYFGIDTLEGVIRAIFILALFLMHRHKPLMKYFTI